MCISTRTSTSNYKQKKVLPDLLLNNFSLTESIYIDNGFLGFLILHENFKQSVGNRSFLILVLTHLNSYISQKTIFVPLSIFDGH